MTGVYDTLGNIEGESSTDMRGNQVASYLYRPGKLAVNLFTGVITEGFRVGEPPVSMYADVDIDSILWVGFPGCYGFYGVADVLNGSANPSGHLPDTYAVDSQSSPAMQNYGYISYSNGDGVAANSYVVEAEGTGYDNLCHGRKWNNYHQPAG